MVGSLGTRCRSRLLAAGAAVVAVVVVTCAAVAAAAAAEWNVAMVGGPLPDTGISIAVVDSGVDASHPAFGSRVLPQVSIAAGTGDDNGHGTHVAGTAAGGAVDCGSGSSGLGVAPGATILPVRVLDEDGVGTVSDVAEGIREAADRGAQVINLSLGPELDLGGLSSASEEFEDAIRYAWQKGSIPVLAAGNGSLVGGVFGSGYGDLPAVVVTAVTRDGTKAGYATAVGSAQWGIAAPGGSGSREFGEDVLSAWPDRQCALSSGTSMAAPHVAGALAVLRGRGLSAQQAVDRILETATPKEPRSTYGAGVLDLTAAVEGIPASGPSTPEAGPTTTTAPPTSTTAPSTTGSRTTATPSTAPTPAPSTVPSSTTAPSVEPVDDDDDAVAAGGVSIEPEEEGSDRAPLAVVAGLVCAAVWALAGRAAWSSGLWGRRATQP